MGAAPRRVILAANSAWNIVNFRAGLIRALRQQGYEPVVVAPPDAALESRMDELQVGRVAVGIDRSGLNPLADLRLLGNYRRILIACARPRSWGLRSSPTSTAASPPVRSGFRRSPTSAGSARRSSGRARCVRS